MVNERVKVSAQDDSQCQMALLFLIRGLISHLCARVQSSLVFCRIFLWPDQQPATFVLVDGGVVDVAEISLLDTATRFAFACVLKHCGLLADALERTG